MGNTIPTAQAPSDVHATLQEELPQLAFDSYVGQGKFMKSMKCPSSEGGSALVKVYTLPQYEQLAITRRRFKAALSGRTSLPEEQQDGTRQEKASSNADQSSLRKESQAGLGASSESSLKTSLSKSSRGFNADGEGTPSPSSPKKVTQESQQGGGKQNQGDLVHSKSAAEFVMSNEPWSTQFMRACKRINALSKCFSLTRQPNVLPYQFYSIGRRHSVAILARQFLSSTLHDRLHTRPFLTSIEKRWVAYQLLCTLIQCHSAGVCHGDIKTENIGMTSWGWILLTDFASFKPPYLPETGDFDYFFDPEGRRRCYLAPERFLQQDQNVETSATSGTGYNQVDENGSYSYGPEQSAARVLLGNAVDMSAGHFDSLHSLLDAVTGATKSFQGSMQPSSQEGTYQPSRDVEGASSVDKNIWPGPAEASDPRLLPSMDIFSAGCCIGELFMEGKSVRNLENLFDTRRNETGTRLSENSPAYTLRKAVDNELVVDLVSRMTQMSPLRRGSALTYIHDYTGLDNLFPPSFVTCLFPFFSSLMQSSMVSPDYRAKAVCEAYPWLLAEITGTSDPVGELYFRQRLALEHYSSLERTWFASTDTAWENAHTSSNTTATNGAGFNDMREKQDWITWEWMNGHATSSDRGPGTESSASSWLSSTPPWGLYEEWQPGPVTSRRLIRLREQVGAKYFHAVSSEESDSTVDTAGPEEYSDNESQGSSPASPSSPCRNLPQSDGVLLPAPRAHAEGVTMVIVLLCSCARHVTSPTLRVTSLALLGRLGAMKCTPDEVRLQRIIPYAVDLFRDPSSLVRAHAVMVVAAMLQQVRSFPPSDSGIVLKYIIPALNNLPNDPEPAVRAACAAAIPRISAAARRFVETEQWNEQLAALERLDPENSEMSQQRTSETEQQSSSETSVSIINGPAEEESDRVNSEENMEGRFSPSKNLRFRYSFEYRLRELQMRMKSLLHLWMSSLNGMQGSDVSPVSASNNKGEGGYSGGISSTTMRSTAFGTSTGFSARAAATGSKEHQDALRSISNQASTTTLTAAMSVLASASLVENSKFANDSVSMYHHATAAAFGAWARFTKACAKLPSLYYSAFCQQSMLRNIPLLCHSFGRELVEETIFPWITSFLNGSERGNGSGDWRTHSEFFLALPGICSFVGKASTEHLFSLVLEEGPYDAVPQVSHSALVALSTIVQQQLINTTSVVNMLSPPSSSSHTQSTYSVGALGFLLHPSFWVRHAAARLIATLIVELQWPDAHAYVAPLLAPILSTSARESRKKEDAPRWREINFWNKIHAILDKLSKCRTEMNDESLPVDGHGLRTFTQSNVARSRAYAWAVYRVQKALLSSTLPPVSQGVFSLAVCFDTARMRNDILQSLTSELQGGTDANFADAFQKSTSLATALENPSLSTPTMWFSREFLRAYNKLQSIDDDQFSWTQCALYGFSAPMDFLRYRVRCMEYISGRIAKASRRNHAWQARLAADAVQYFRPLFLQCNPTDENPRLGGSEKPMDLMSAIRWLLWKSGESQISRQSGNCADKHPSVTLPYSKATLRNLACTKFYLPDQRYASMFPRAPPSVLPLSERNSNIGNVHYFGEEASVEWSSEQQNLYKPQSDYPVKASSSLKGMKSSGTHRLFAPSILSSVAKENSFIASNMVRSSAAGGSGAIRCASPPLLGDRYVLTHLWFGSDQSESRPQSQVYELLYDATTTSSAAGTNPSDWGAFYMMQCFSSGVRARRNYLRYGLWDPHVTVTVPTDAIMSAGAQPGAGDGLLLSVRNSSSGSASDAVLRPSNSKVHDDPTLEVPQWESVTRNWEKAKEAEQQYDGEAFFESENIWDGFEGTHRGWMEALGKLDQLGLPNLRWSKSSYTQAQPETSLATSPPRQQMEAWSSFAQTSGQAGPTKREIITGPGQAMSAKRRDPMLAAARYASAACSAMIAACCNEDREILGLKDDLPDAVDSWMSFATGFGQSGDSVVKPYSHLSEGGTAEKRREDHKEAHADQSQYYHPEDSIIGLTTEQIQAVLSAPRGAQSLWLHGYNPKFEEGGGSVKGRHDAVPEVTSNRNLLSDATRKDREASFVADACIPLHGSIRHHQNRTGNENAPSGSLLIGVPTPGLAKSVSIKPDQVQELLYRPQKQHNIEAFEDHFMVNEANSKKKLMSKSSRRVDQSEESVSHDIPSDLDFLAPSHLSAFVRRARAMELPPLPPYLGFVHLRPPASTHKSDNRSDPKVRGQFDEEQGYLRPFIPYFATLLSKLRMQRAADTMDSLGSSSVLHKEGNIGNIASKDEDPVFGSDIDPEFAFIGEPLDENESPLISDSRGTVCAPCSHTRQGAQQGHSDHHNDPYFVPLESASDSPSGTGDMLNFLGLLRSVFNKGDANRMPAWREFLVTGIKARSEFGKLYDLSAESRCLNSCQQWDPIYLHMISPSSCLFHDNRSGNTGSQLSLSLSPQMYFTSQVVLPPVPSVGDGSGYSGKGTASFVGSKLDLTGRHVGSRNNSEISNLVPAKTSLLTRPNLGADDYKEARQAAKQAQTKGVSALSKARAESSDTWGSKPHGLLLSTFVEHSAAVNAIAVSQDHSFFVTASDDGTCRVWPTERLGLGPSSSSLMTYGGQAGRITSLTIIESSSSVVSGSSEGTVDIWRISMEEARMAMYSYSSGSEERNDGYRSTVLSSLFRESTSSREGSEDVDSGSSLSRNIGVSGGIESTRKYNNSSQPCKSTGIHLVQRLHYPGEGGVVNVKQFVTSTQILVLAATRRGRIHAYDLRLRREIWKLCIPPEFGCITVMVTFAGDNESYADKATSSVVLIGTDRGVIAAYDLRFQLLVCAWRHSSRLPISDIWPYLSQGAPAERFTQSTAPANMPSTPSVVRQLAACIASGDADAGFWNLETGQCLRILRVVEGHLDQMKSEDVLRPPFLSRIVTRGNSLAQPVDVSVVPNNKQGDNLEWDKNYDSEALDCYLHEELTEDSNNPKYSVRPLVSCLLFPLPGTSHRPRSRNSKHTAGSNKDHVDDNWESLGAVGEYRYGGGFTLHGMRGTGAARVSSEAGAAFSGHRKYTVACSTDGAKDHSNVEGYKREQSYWDGYEADLDTIPAWLLTGGSDRTVRCWDLRRPRGSYTVAGLEPGQERHAYEGHPSLPYSVLPNYTNPGQEASPPQGDFNVHTSKDALSSPELNCLSSEIPFMLLSHDEYADTRETDEVPEDIEEDGDDPLDATADKEQLPSLRLRGSVPPPASHTDCINCMEWLDLPGRLLVTGSRNGVVKVWK